MITQGVRQIRSEDIKYRSDHWGALAQNPTLEIGATGEAWARAVLTAWLNAGGTEESFARALPRLAAQVAQAEVTEKRVRPVGQ